MTVHDFKLWSKIQNYELVDHCCQGKEKKPAPNGILSFNFSPFRFYPFLVTNFFLVVAMLAHFTYFSEWVASVICLCERTKERAKILLKFLEIASKLKNLNNFFGVLQIFTGKKQQERMATFSFFISIFLLTFPSIKQFSCFSIKRNFFYRSFKDS